MKICCKNPNLVKIGQKYWGTLLEDLKYFLLLLKISCKTFMCSTQCFIWLTSDMWLNNRNRTFFALQLRQSRYKYVADFGLLVNLL